MVHLMGLRRNIRCVNLVLTKFYTTCTGNEVVSYAWRHIYDHTRHMDMD